MNVNNRNVFRGYPKMHVVPAFFNLLTSVTWVRLGCSFFWNRWWCVYVCVCVCVCVFFGGKELYLAVIWSWEVGKKCNFNGAGAAKSPRGKWGRLLRKHSFSSCKTWCKLSTSWQQAKLYSLAKYLGILRILSSYLSEARFKSRSVWLPNLVHFSVRLFTWINL